MNTADIESHQKVKAGHAAIHLQRHLLQFSGNDHVRYLNGQLTNNVTTLKPDTALFSAVSNIKGKMDGEVWLTPKDSAILVDLPLELADSLPARLGKYIIADDVTLEDVSMKWDIYHLLGDVLPQKLAGLSHVKSKRFGEWGWDIWLAKGESFPLETTPYSIWDTVRIENRFPRWGQEMNHDTLPPELGIEDMMISYKKGCYIGQEIIARIKSVGHVNRHLRLLVSEEGNTLPDVPSECFDEDKKAGVLTSACWSPLHKKVVALGLINRHYAQEHILRSKTHAWKILS